MSRRLIAVLSVVVVVLSIAIGGQAAASAAPGVRAGAQAATPELSETSRLQDRREVAAGTRACLFTDQANPTSNRLYETLGYRPVVDMANLRVEAPGE